MNKKKIIVPICKRIKEKTLDWKKTLYLTAKLPVLKKKNILNKKESLSINKNYNELNWSFFISKHRKKYLPNCCNINSTKNVIYLNKFFLYRFILKNERLCKKLWTPISLLKNKIRFYYI